MPKVTDIAAAIEQFAPLSLQEEWDNCGLQVGLPDSEVTAVLVCLDVTPEVLAEAEKRECNMVVSHHPLIFRGLKHITGSTPTESMVATAIQRGISIYSAHTNVDNAPGGMSYEMARLMHLRNVEVLCPQAGSTESGLGVIGDIEPLPALEFLRRVKETFHVKGLRYSANSPTLVIRKVAMCGGAGADFIKDAIRSNADVYVSGDIKYHEMTSYADKILIADIGHFDSEVCVRKIFAGILRQKFPELCIYISDSEKNPVALL